jgi:biopolymer transport protein ExbB
MEGLVELFNKGGLFMWPILVLLVVGLGFSIERVVTLTRASVNTRKFLARLHSALQDGGIEGAAAECEKTPGPVASILHAGLSRADKGLESVEKSISNAGSIEMAFLERGMVVLSTVIVLAPMVGFTGTVQGMVEAFQQIETKNDISPAIVAGGISQALLTTLFGLVVAMIIQVFYNFFNSRIDKLILDMEESSVELMDALVDLDHKK